MWRTFLDAVGFRGVAATAPAGQGAEATHGPHIRLVVHGSDGVEPVHVEPLGGRRYRLLYSPGLVAGVAAGDEVELLDDRGRFQVVHRSGNLAVQVFSETPVQPFRAGLEAEVRDRLSGTLDGGIECGLVFTIPLSAGFSAIEEVFDRFVRTHAGTEWMYGNVYDPDTGAPLRWWDASQER